MAVCLAVAVADAAYARESDKLLIDEVEKGSPTQLEDAYPLEYRELDLEGLFRYEKVANGHGYVWSPRIEYGFAPDWQARVSTPFLSGKTATDEPLHHTLQVEILHNFRYETGYSPALAASVELDFPTGRGQGLDTTVKFLASKTLGTSPMLPRLHLNVAWTHNAAPQAGERNNLYSLVAGYTRLLTDRLMVIVDFFRQQAFTRGQTENVFEVGVRFAVTSAAVVAAGVGYGVGSDSRDFHLQAGVEFTIW
ncbi:MAG TPA: hypothetical protein VGQ08_15400 [Nitrospiraceae bacterium]|nr:hypothetical protein [Nitrospiraceae bacterium]